MKLLSKFLSIPILTMMVNLPSSTLAFVCPSSSTRRSTSHIHPLVQASEFPTLMQKSPFKPTTVTTNSVRSSTFGRRRYQSRTSTSLSSAKILPIAYTAVSVALFEKALTTAVQSSLSSTPADLYSKVVLFVTGLVSLIKYGPSDNAKLASAKRAYKLTPPASSGKAKQKRQAAKTWKSVVRIKLIGQFLGLLYMARAVTLDGIMKGATIIMLSNVLYFLCGAGNSYHDDDGNWKPMSTETSWGGTIFHLVLMICTTLVKDTTTSSTFTIKNNVLVGTYVIGALLSTLNGISKFLQSISGIFNQKKQ